MDEPLLTRLEVASRLGVSQSEIRRREKVGLIRPRRRNSKGWVMYHPDDLIGQNAGPMAPPPVTRKSADPYTADEVELVFKALEQGKSLVQCVLDCRVMPATVELLATDYARLTGGMYVRKDAMDLINALPLEGTFPLKGEAALVEVLKAASADTCKKCNVRGRVYCKPCALKASERAAKDGL